MAAVIESDSGAIEPVEGSMERLMPFFLALLSNNMNETGMAFLLKLLENSYVGQCLEFYLKKVLVLLLAYQGPQAFTVGEAIA